MNDLDFNGERYVPGKSPLQLEAEHLARYEFVLDFVKGMRVLDLGCGEGYGSSMLADVADSVLGLDIDPRSIAHAKEVYMSENLSFVEGDVAKLPFKDGAFDAVVSFEVIEHIENPGNLLKQALRILKTSGVLIVSTPNGAVKTASVPNPFHVKEFTIGEFNDLIGETFPAADWDLTMYGQFVKGKSYSVVGVGLKNAGLSVKGAFGLSEPLFRRSEHSAHAPAIEYEFHTDKAHLAEYLLAVIRGRG